MHRLPGSTNRMVLEAKGSSAEAKFTTKIASHAITRRLISLLFGREFGRREQFGLLRLWQRHASMARYKIRRARLIGIPGWSSCLEELVEQAVDRIDQQAVTVAARYTVPPFTRKTTASQTPYGLRVQHVPETDPRPAARHVPEMPAPVTGTAAESSPVPRRLCNGAKSASKQLYLRPRLTRHLQYVRQHAVLITPAALIPGVLVVQVRGFVDQNLVATPRIGTS